MPKKHQCWYFRGILEESVEKLDGVSEGTLVIALAQLSYKNCTPQVSTGRWEAADCGPLPLGESSGFWWRRRKKVLLGQDPDGLEEAVHPWNCLGT